METDEKVAALEARVEVLTDAVERLLLARTWDLQTPEAARNPRGRAALHVAGTELSVSDNDRLLTRLGRPHGACGQRLEGVASSHG